MTDGFPPARLSAALPLALLAACAGEAEPNFLPVALEASERTASDDGAPREPTPEEIESLRELEPSEYVEFEPPTAEEAHEMLFAFLRTGEVEPILVHVEAWEWHDDRSLTVRGLRRGLDGSEESIAVSLPAGWDCATPWRPVADELALLYQEVPAPRGDTLPRAAMAIAGGGVPPVVRVDPESMAASYPWASEPAADILEVGGRR